MPYLDLYKKTPYEPLLPTSGGGEQMAFKFNSPRHFFGWIEGLEGFKRNTKMDSSESGDRNFCLSRNLADAHNILRETVFDPRKTEKLQTHIMQLKPSTMYSDEGYELDVAEHLAGSDRVWIKTKTNRKPTRIIDDILVIDACYNADKNAAIIRDIGIDMLTSIYRRGVIPRKMVLIFGNRHYRERGTEGSLCAIDVSFSDLNGIAQLLHPAAFRRLYFRFCEMYADLTGGYGSSTGSSTQRGYISINHIYGTYGNAQFEVEIDKFLGVSSKK